MPGPSSAVGCRARRVLRPSRTESAGVGAAPLDGAFRPGRGRGGRSSPPPTSAPRPLLPLRLCGPLPDCRDAGRAAPDRGGPRRGGGACRAGQPADRGDPSDRSRRLEFERGDEFRWLAELREGYLYRRGGEPIGFAFVGSHGSGPIAALDATDQAAILSHVESRASELGVDELGLELPMVNEVAIRHLLDRGFRFDPFYTFLMSNRPFGRFDRYLGFSPPFVL